MSNKQTAASTRLKAKNVLVHERNRMDSKPLARKVLALALGGMAAPAGAIDFIWLGGTGNWSPNLGTSWNQAAGLPGAADNVFIDDGNATDSVVSLNIGATIDNLNPGLTAIKN